MCNTKSIAIGDDEEIGPELVSQTGPILLQRTFSGEELFESIISRFAIEQIDARDHIGEELRKEHSQFTKEFGHTLLEEREFLALHGPLVIVDPEEARVERRLHSRAVQAIAQQELLAADETAIPHRTYIEWLLRWFPGRIRIRSLPQASHSPAGAFGAKQ